MADWPLKHDGPCACRFVRREEFGEAEQVEWCGLHAKQRDDMAAIRDALEWYADSANWRRMKGRADMGPKSWSRPAAAIDRGARAKFLLTQLTPNVELCSMFEAEKD